jgi:ankyrin repeat protein
MVLSVSKRLSSLSYVDTTTYDDDTLHESGDYHLIVRLKRKCTTLYYICIGGNIDVVRLMISRGANNWNYGLYGACEGGHLELANLMISYGANNWDWGLEGACIGGHLELARLMISN